MTTLSTTYPARSWRLQRVGFLAALARSAARLIGALATERKNRHDERELLTLSDHMLKDIGLMRMQVASGVRYGRFE